MKGRIVVSEASGPAGAYRTYLKGPDGKEISPYFPDLAALFPWMRANGWTLDNSEHPWGAMNGETWPDVYDNEGNKV